MATPPMLDELAPRRALPPHRPDPAVAVSVALLALSGAGLLLGAILAVYTYEVPGAERPLFFGVLTTFLAAVGVQALAGVTRWVRRVAR